MGGLGFVSGFVGFFVFGGVFFKISLIFCVFSS